ncbi:MAG: glutathione peroxidase [Prosthecobacter sp.]|nr:glutathione peroxidase [Prosthecobacter sp.]
MTALTAAAADGISEISLTTIDGKAASTKDYQGKVLLVVNVASECGYTGQYAGLQALHEKYNKEGFAVLGFPCNDFGGQEPAAEADIKTFCATRYNVTFPMFEKVKITGPAKHPLYAALTGTSAPFPGDVQWNFTKFLIGKDGKILARFESDVEPDSSQVADAIKAALGK